MGFNIKREEYLCPLCETIGNSVLPLFPELKELTFPLLAATSSSSSPPSSPTMSNKATTSSKEAETMEVTEEEDESEMMSHHQTRRKATRKERKRKQIDLSYEDWLDGLEKTLENSIKKEMHDDKG